MTSAGLREGGRSVEIVIDDAVALKALLFDKATSDGSGNVFVGRVGNSMTVSGDGGAGGGGYVAQQLCRCATD